MSRYLLLLVLTSCTTLPPSESPFYPGPAYITVIDGGVRMPPMAHEMTPCGQYVCVR